MVRASQPPPHWLYSFILECPRCRAQVQATQPGDFDALTVTTARTHCAACGAPLLVVRPPFAQGLVRYPYVSILSGGLTPRT